MTNNINGAAVGANVNPYHSIEAQHKAQASAKNMQAARTHHAAAAPLKDTSKKVADVGKELTAKNQEVPSNKPNSKDLEEYEAVCFSGYCSEGIMEISFEEFLAWKEREKAAAQAKL